MDIYVFINAYNICIYAYLCLYTHRYYLLIHIHIYIEKHVIMYYNNMLYMFLL